MRFRTISLLLTIAFIATPVFAEEAKKLTTDREKVSYSFGMKIGDDLIRGQIDLDIDLLLQGIKDHYTGGKELLTQDEAKEAFVAFQEKRKTKMAAQRQVQGEQNRMDGKSFLETNGKKEGVITTSSGLQYTVLQEGTGGKPGAIDNVKVHYAGTLINGTPFDSSYDRGEPAVFNLSRVIKGWTEGLQLMKVGGKNRLFVPSDLAYGENGAGQTIEPNSTLIFDVELLAIVDEGAATPHH